MISARCLLAACLVVAATQVHAADGWVADDITDILSKVRSIFTTITGNIKDAADDLVRTLRGLLWLKGHAEFKDAIEVVGQVETLTTRKLPGLRTAVHTAMPAGWGDFDRLYHDVEALGEIINAW